jgi:hypothetical protein
MYKKESIQPSLAGYSGSIVGGTVFFTCGRENDYSNKYSVMLGLTEQSHNGTTHGTYLRPISKAGV